MVGLHVPQHDATESLIDCNFNPSRLYLNMSSTSPPYSAITHQPHEDPIRYALNSTDLLIRAISMILFLLWPEAELSQPRSDSSYQRLDRLSLLFVSGGGADVAAISAVIHKDGVVVEAVQECNDPVVGQLEVWKDHDRRCARRISGFVFLCPFIVSSGRFQGFQPHPTQPSRNRLCWRIQLGFA